MSNGINGSRVNSVGGSVRDMFQNTYHHHTREYISLVLNAYFSPNECPINEHLLKRSKYVINILKPMIHRERKTKAHAPVTYSRLILAYDSKVHITSGREGPLLFCHTFTFIGATLCRTFCEPRDNNIGRIRARFFDEPVYPSKIYLRLLPR